MFYNGTDIVYLDWKEEDETKNSGLNFVSIKYE